MTLVNFESLGAFSPHATQKITYQELSFARFSESSQKILFGQVGKWLRGPAIRKLVRCLSVYNSSPADYKIGPPMLLTEAGFIHNASSYFGDDVKGQTTFLRGRLLEILYTKDRPLSIELLRLTTLFDRFLNFGERVVAPRRCLSEHPFEKMLRTAIENGHVEVVRALLDHNAPLSPHCLGAKTVFAAQKGHLEIVWMLLDHFAIIPASYHAELLKYAARNGWLDIICYLLSLDLTFHEYDLQETFENAAKIGHLEIIGALINRYGISERARDSTVVAAAEGGHVEIIRKLLEGNASISGFAGGDAIVRASKNGHVDAVRALLKNCTPQIIEHREIPLGDAKSDAIVALILHLHDNHDTHIELHRGLAVEYAAENGHIEIVRLLLKDATISKFCMDNAMEKATKKQRLDIVDELSMH